MVLLTLPPHLLDAVEVYNSSNPTSPIPLPATHLDHRQIHHVSQSLLSTSAENDKYRLRSLLRGCSVYIPPKPPKPEPVLTSPFPYFVARG